MTTVDDLAREVADAARGRLMTATLVGLIESLAAAGPGGVDVGVIRDPHVAAAVSLLDVAGLVETAPGKRLRLTEGTRRRLGPAREVRPS
jgi:hypothetical protein